MDDPADDPRLTPITLRKQFIADGWSDRTIAAELSAGRLVRVRRGAYVDAPAWTALDAGGRHLVRARAVLAQADTESVPSHVSGVPFHAGPTWGLDLSQVHTTRLDGKTGRREASVCQHSGRVEDGDVTEAFGVRAMGATRTALEVTTMASTEVSLVVVNDFLHRELTTPEQLRTRYDAGIDGWPSTLRTDLVIRLADPRIESVLESRFLYLCFRFHLPRPEPQYKVLDPVTGELVARLDFAWPSLGRYVECNGKEKYDRLLAPGQRPGDVVFRQERRAGRVHEITGFVGMHVGWDDVERPGATAQTVRQFLTAPTRAFG